VNQGITVNKSEGSTSFSEDRSYKLNSLEAGNVPVFTACNGEGKFLSFENLLQDVQPVTSYFTGLAVLNPLMW
jgi:hypothetical protein